MTQDQLIKLLLDAGFDSGWVISGDTLSLWEHEEEPPVPLKRPEQATQ
jgi:hypothetical protein